jgi:hypothetical protein
MREISGKWQHLLLGALASFLVTACGGGGGGGSSAGGNSAAAPKDIAAPTVSSVMPLDASSGNTAAATISISFSETLNCASVGAGGISLSESGKPIAGVTGCSSNTLTFTPASDLPTNASVLGSLNTSVSDLAGNALVGVFTWSFGVAPWTFQAGTVGNDIANALAIDSSGNLYLAGSSNGSPDGTVNAGGSDSLIVKIDKRGVRQWSRLLGTNEADFSTAISVDSSGDLLIGGVTDGNLFALPHIVGSFGFVARYDNTGTKLWASEFGSSSPFISSQDFVRAVTSDFEGNVIAAGFTDGSLFGTSAGGIDMFVVKYSGPGTQLWGVQSGTSTTDNAAGVVTDATGNIYVTGYTFGGLDGNVNAGSADIFIRKFTSAGTLVWTRQLGSPGLDVATCITIDTSGNLYIAGRTEGALDGNVSLGALDAFVAKFDGNGTKLWLIQFGTAADDFATSISLDPSGNILVAGSTTGDFEGHTNAGLRDAFVAKFSNAGTRLWQQQAGTPGDEVVSGVKTDAAGNIYVAGNSDGNFDGIVNAGGTDVFILKFQADGTRR